MNQYPLDLTESELHELLFLIGKEKLTLKKRLPISFGYQDWFQFRINLCQDIESKIRGCLPVIYKTELNILENEKGE